MSGKTDEVKGRIKEAEGALTNDDNLRKEGKADQKVGKAKQVVAAQKALDKAKDATETCRTDTTDDCRFVRIGPDVQGCPRPASQKTPGPQHSKAHHRDRSGRSGITAPCKG